MISSPHNLVPFLILFCFSFHFRIVGNPLICGVKAENCSAVLPEPLSLPPDALKGIYMHVVFLFSTVFVVTL